MVLKYLFSFILILASCCNAYSKTLHSITVGYSDTLEVTKEAANLICLSHEADHPNNHCTTEYIDAEQLWDKLTSNDVQIALMPEETLLSNRQKKRQPLVIMPMYQQYLIVVGNNEMAHTQTNNFIDRTIGVTDWVTKEYRGKPLAKALGLNEKDIYFPVSQSRSQLAELFCSFSIDGVMIMSAPSSALARELTTSCDGHILSFTHAQIQKVIKAMPGLYPATISKDLYWRLDEDIQTLRSRTFLVINPSQNVVNTFGESLEHINTELSLTTLRRDITPESILESYDLNPIPLHALGQKLINMLRHPPNEDPTEQSVHE